MSINSKLVKALKPLVPTVVPGVYTGKEDRFITFNYDLVPMNYHDNSTNWWRALIQVHLFVPLGENSLGLRQRISSALIAADFRPPEIADATDKDGQHYIFETEILSVVKEDD